VAHEDELCCAATKTRQFDTLFEGGVFLFFSFFFFPLDFALCHHPFCFVVPIFSVKLEPYFFLIGTVFLDLGSQLDGQGEPPLALVGLLPSGWDIYHGLRPRFSHTM
jgi:hypothetical protein